MCRGDFVWSEPHWRAALVPPRDCRTKLPIEMYWISRSSPSFITGLRKKKQCSGSLLIAGAFKFFQVFQQRIDVSTCHPRPVVEGKKR